MRKGFTTTILATGMNSKTATRTRDRKEVLHLERQKQISKLYPSAVEILASIAKEKAKQDKISANVNEIELMRPEDLKVELLAKKKYIGYLTQWEAKLKKIVADVEKKQEKENE